jgi:hypothetical protein
MHIDSIAFVLLFKIPSFMSFCKGLRKGCRCLVTGLYSMKKLPYARVEFI